METKIDYIITFDSDFELTLYHFINGYTRSKNPNFANTLIKQTNLQNEGILTFTTQFNMAYAEYFFRKTLSEDYIDVLYSEKLSFPSDPKNLEKELLTFMKRTNINYLELRMAKTKKRAVLLINMSRVSSIKIIDKSIFDDSKKLSPINLSNW
ncbi:hypothetical protein [Carnobacterium maltaromaticum]|uniref:hypothetical protein n=1 Tax=Carnobacterium maltaromaticum TaxID=2751 RepID=UPI00295EC575|nr:hypothetical protein [Carnobacterium maltaromaticum]